jgi:hypothetical protein
VYLSADELLDLERARLTLLAHGIGVDRGRLVREAIAVLMMDLEAGIDASVVARRLGAAGRSAPADPAPVPVPARGVLANGTHDALVAGAFTNGAPAEGAPTDGGPHQGALVSGALISGAPAEDGPTDGGPHQGALVSGALISGALTGGALGNGGTADGGLVAGAPLGAQ